MPRLAGRSGSSRQPMRLNEQHQLISQGIRWQATPYVPFSAVATIPALFLPSSRQECQEDATDLVRTSQLKSSPNRKKISSNTAPTAPTLSIPSTSAREIPRPRHRQCASERHLITACCTLPCKTYVSAIPKQC